MNAATDHINGPTAGASPVPFAPSHEDRVDPIFSTAGAAVITGLSDLSADFGATDGINETHEPVVCEEVSLIAGAESEALVAIPMSPNVDAGGVELEVVEMEVDDPDPEPLPDEPLTPSEVCTRG